MADVVLYLDPVCPFSWVTARWLLDAAQSTHTPVAPRQMSLAVLNEGQDGDAKQQHMMERSTRLDACSPRPLPRVNRTRSRASMTR